jgi:hypothetical protein
MMESKDPCFSEAFLQVSPQAIILIVFPIFENIRVVLSDF